MSSGIRQGVLQGVIFIGTASSIRQGVLNGDDFAGKELQGNNISRENLR